MNLNKILKITAAGVSQLLLIIFLTFLFQKGLEVIPVPDVFKNMSIIELNDLDDGIIQSGADFKYKLSGIGVSDTNVIIINTNNPNPGQIRGSLAKAINFLKKSEAKVIGLDFLLDKENPEKAADDTALAKAIKDADNVVSINSYVTGQRQNNLSGPDTIFSLQPVPLFKNALKSATYQNLESAEGDKTDKKVKFYPNINYYGNIVRSFPLELAYQYDSARTSILKGQIQTEGLNYPDLEKFKYYLLDYISNDETNYIFAPYIKEKIVLIGYIKPPEDPIATEQYVTPVGRIDFVVMYAGMVSDILLKKFVPSSPDEIDYMVGAIFGIFNIFLFAYASKKSTALESFCGGMIIPVEIIVIYLMVMIGFIFFDYKLSVAVPAIVSMVSVPFNSLLRKTIIPSFIRINARYKLRKYPYPFVQNFLTTLESSKRSIRHLSLFHGFFRTFLFMKAFSYAGMDKDEKIESFKVKDWEKLKEHIEKSRKSLLNERLLRAINKVSKLSSLDSFVTSSYSSTFDIDNIRKEIFDRVEVEKEIEPKLDVFEKYNPILSRLIGNLSQEFLGFEMLYVLKRRPDNYLVQFFDSKNPAPLYLKSELELVEKEVYLVSPDKKEYVPLSPFIVFRMCSFHRKLELFVFADKKFDEATGEEKCNYIGEYFPCSLIFSPKF